jgi:hypothetical protein
MDKNVKLLLACLILLVLTTTVAATTYYSFYVPQSVTVQVIYNAQVYLNGTLFNNGTVVNWGTYAPNTTKTQSLNVKNTGNVQAKVTFIAGMNSSMVTNGWSCKWNVNGTVLNVGGWANGTLTLVIPNVSTNGTYTWNSWIHMGN